MIKNYYLKGVLGVYIIAFTSLYVQVQSLFGDNGVVPIKDFLAKKEALNFYNIISIAPQLGLSHGTFVELLCIVGVLVAFLGLYMRRLVNAVSFGLLWYIYYSICQLGQGFMSFHSDLLLLEVGFISILLAPLIPSSKLSQSDHDHLSFFLLKWVVFRYFVSNILNIFLDGDDAWYKMTGIQMVAQGFPFPSLLSWHLYNLNPEHIKLLSAYGQTTKLITPFLLFFDLKYSRSLAFYTLLFQSIVQVLALNHGWFDILICVCLTSALYTGHHHNDKRNRQSRTRSLIDILVIVAYLWASGFILIRYFGVKYDGSTLKAQVSFSPAQFKLFVDHFVPISFVVGILGLLSAAYTTFFKTNRKTSIIKTLIYSILVAILFFSTFPTLSRFSPGLDGKVKTLAYTKNLSRMVAPLHLSNNYIIISKVSQNYADGRVELQVQGRASAEDPTWHQYELRYKPGLPGKSLARVVPHLPRIDLKMWYASRSSLQNNNWLQTLCYRLATGERDVVSTVTPDDRIFKANQVRIVAFNYRFVSIAKPSSSGYWQQPSFKSEYMPPTSLENLKFAVKSNGISLAQATKAPESAKLAPLDKLLSKYLEISSDYVRKADPITIIWALTAICFISAIRL